MGTVFQMQQENKSSDMNNESVFFIALKHTVVRQQFLILEKVTLQLSSEEIWVERAEHMMGFNGFYF